MNISAKNKFRFPSIQTLWDDFMNENVMPGIRAAFSPAVNVKEEKDAYRLEVAVPGGNKDDFDISVHNNVLHISSENKTEREDKGDNYTRKEWSYQSFKRSFSLPDDADENSISAEYSDGVLKINIKRSTAAANDNGKKITVS